MHSYKDIFGLNIKYIDFLLARSLFSHQYIKNISQSGGDVEGETREMFRNIIPERYKVTHGYIVSAPDKNTEPLISPQVDMIIVDTLVPHSLFIVDKKNGLEIVPLEAVVAIFEIKRTLNHTILQDANSHLQKIRTAVLISKDSTERYGPGGLHFGNGLSGGAYCNPLLGIIGLDLDANILTDGHAHHIENLNPEFLQTEVDLICGFMGMLLAIADTSGSGNFRIANPRVKGEMTQYCLLKQNEHYSQANIIARMFGYVLGYLYNTSGRVANFNNYFFNNNL